MSHVGGGGVTLLHFSIVENNLGVISVTPTHPPFFGEGGPAMTSNNKYCLRVLHISMEQIHVTIPVYFRSLRPNMTQRALHNITCLVKPEKSRDKSTRISLCIGAVYL